MRSVTDLPPAPVGETQEPAVPPARLHHHFLVQAPVPAVPAVDADGIRVVTVGTALFAVASVVLGLLHPQLVDSGRGWWLAVSLSGTGLGLLGLLYCRQRVRRRR
jgi:hypothetical protein